MSISRHLTGLRRFAKAAVAVCASLGLVLAAGGCGASSGESKTIYFWNNLVGDDGPAMQYARTLEGVFKQIGVCGINARASLAIAAVWWNVILSENA